MFISYLVQNSLRIKELYYLSFIYLFILRYNWCKTYWFQVHNIMMWSLYILSNDTSATLHSSRSFFLWWELLIFTLINFQICTTVLLTIVAMCTLRPTACSFYNWKLVPLARLVHTPPPSFGNHQSVLCEPVLCVCVCRVKVGFCTEVRSHSVCPSLSNLFHSA